MCKKKLRQIHTDFQAQKQCIEVSVAVDKKIGESEAKKNWFAVYSENTGVLPYISGHKIWLQTLDLNIEGNAHYCSLRTKACNLFHQRFDPLTLREMKYTDKYLVNSNRGELRNIQGKIHVLYDNYLKQKACESNIQREEYIARKRIEYQQNKANATKVSKHEKETSGKQSNIFKKSWNAVAAGIAKITPFSTYDIPSDESLAIGFRYVPSGKPECEFIEKWLKKYYEFEKEFMNHQSSILLSEAEIRHKILETHKNMQQNRIQECRMDFTRQYNKWQSEHLNDKQLRFKIQRLDFSNNQTDWCMLLHYFCFVFSFVFIWL